ncbi:MAG: hypothetical protein QW059_01100 [Nitrososphaerota archaeon]
MMKRALSRSEYVSLSRFLRVESLPPQLVFIESGKKVRCATRAALETAAQMKGLVTVGIYAAKKIGDEYYLSVEGSQLLGPYMEGGVVEVSMSEAEEWMRGAPLKKEPPDSDIAVVKLDWLYLGSGKVSRDGKIYPLIPKERMISSSRSRATR